MIKEILLSLAVAAFSGVSSFVGSPKRTLDNLSGVYGEYYFHAEALDGGDPNGSYFQTPLGNSNGYFALNSSGADWEYFSVPSTEHPDLRIAFVSEDATPSLGSCAFRFTWYFETASLRDTFQTYLETEGALTWNSAPNWFDNQLADSDEEGYFSRLELGVTIQQSYDVLFHLINIDPEYTLTKSFNNCDIASSPRLPDTFKTSGQLSYYVLMTAAAGGYGFTSESVTQTGGITIRNFNLFDQYNNSGYYASCSFNVDLPLNNCSLSVTAFLPQYTITANLEHCTASPSIPASYTGTSFSGNYTFTADSGYGFNENYTHWEVSNLFIDSVEFSSLLWGSFYSSVTLHLRASGGNSSISVTAIKYDEESYKLGYEEGREDGWQAGYDRGHADGEIAGDSYGVWNWLKQAARTTGEFLSINLLPGFSIGGLLTALAGLVIIWFFIKGFLFKS